MKISLARDDRTGLYYRPYRTDIEIIRGVYRSYDISDFNISDTVLDLGLNIGSFTFRIASKVKKVIGFEPDKTNFNIAKLNNKENKNTEIFNHAVVGNDDKERYLYISDSNSEASHSLHKKRRVKKELITCTNYQKIINKYRPTIIKSDIEGEEYYLFHKPLPDYVRIFIAEFHFGKKEWREKFKIIYGSLINEQGFKLKKPVNFTDKLWHVEINLWR